MSEPVFLLGPVIGSPSATEDLEELERFICQRVAPVYVEEAQMKDQLDTYSSSAVFTLAEIRAIFPSWRN